MTNDTYGDSDMDSLFPITSKTLFLIVDESDAIVSCYFPKEKAVAFAMQYSKTMGGTIRIVESKCCDIFCDGNLVSEISNNTELQDELFYYYY